jgi:hypothetical protein
MVRRNSSVLQDPGVTCLRRDNNCKVYEYKLDENPPIKHWPDGVVVSLAKTNIKQ